MTMTKTEADAIGWAGALLVLVAYGMVSFQRMRPDTARYQVLNAIGSACLIINTAFHRAFPSTVVNVIWIMIAVAAFVRVRQQGGRGGKT